MIALYLIFICWRVAKAQVEPNNPEKLEPMAAKNFSGEVFLEVWEAISVH